MPHLLPGFFPDNVESNLKEIHISKNDNLFRVGDPVKYLYYIIEGEIKAVRYHIDGMESVMLRATQNEFFAESGIATSQYVCDAIAAKKTKIVAIPIEDIRELLASSIEFTMAFAMNMAKMIRKQCSKNERLRLNKARDRVFHYLVCESSQDKQVKIETTLCEWAAEIGIEPETLYRTLKDLEDESYIKRDKKVIQLLQ